MFKKVSIIALIVFLATPSAMLLRAQSPAAISLTDRVMTASQIYQVISTFFPGLAQQQFDATYKQYLGTILQTEDRREFDLASMALVAELHDGHSWLDRKSTRLNSSH